MRGGTLLLALCTLALAAAAGADQASTPVAGPREIINPRIDMTAYLQVSSEAARHRESRRLTEAEFIRMSRLPHTAILDARSREKFDELHVKGAINLSFPDIAIASLNRMLPDKDARILIYCNNNFANAERPFPSKRYDASLNLSTYISLYTYGYRNVYELGPLLDLAKTRIPMVSSPARVAVRD